LGGKPGAKASPKKKTEEKKKKRWGEGATEISGIASKVGVLFVIGGRHEWEA